MMSRTLRTPQDFVSAGLAEDTQLDDMLDVAARYAVAMTPHLVGLADAADPTDPITRQFRPDASELRVQATELADPIGDNAHSPVSGLVHRHPDRVLFKPVSVCPVYCRFCFRREMVGPDKDGAMSEAELETAFAYIEQHEEIWEVILTGGDPLMMSPRRISAITERLDAIDHVQSIRWHTRMPVADPTRVDEATADAMVSLQGKAVWLVAHVNHAREVSTEARASFRRLAQRGVGLLSQSVLLRGVNDSVSALSDLMRVLVSAGVKPYYLHHLDLAPGTSHFRVPLEEGQALVQALRDTLSGLCVPTFVVDIPGGVSKANATPSDIEIDDRSVDVRGRDGVWRRYEG